MEKNLLYFGKDSKHIAVGEFNTVQVDRLDYLLDGLLEQPSRVNVVPITSPIHLTDFEEFQDGKYEYLFLYGLDRDTTMKFKRSNHPGDTYNLSGPFIIIKRIHDPDAQDVALEQIVPFAPREVNLFGNWFGFSFLNQDVGDEILDADIFKGLLRDMGSMDKTHQQEKIKFVL